MVCIVHMVVHVCRVSPCMIVTCGHVWGNDVHWKVKKYHLHDLQASYDGIGMWVY